MEPNRRYRLDDPSDGGCRIDVTGVKGDMAYGFVVGTDEQIRLDHAPRLVAEGRLVPVDE